MLKSLTQLIPTSRRTLGLVVTRQGMTVAEVLASRGHIRLSRAGELPFAPQCDLQNPAALAAALKEFLKSKGFTARRCIVGLESSYLSAKAKRLPEAASSSLGEILKIACEQDFASDEQELILDYTPFSCEKGVGALLVATKSRSVDQVLAVTNQAGLNVVAVTSSAIVLAAATSPSHGDAQRLLLSLSSAGAELVILTGGKARMVRRLSASITATTDLNQTTRRQGLNELEAELRRVLAASMLQPPPADMELAVWNASDVDEPELILLGERLGLSTRICRFPADIAGLEDSPSGNGQFPAPAALAICLAGKQALALDFLHSRLATRKHRRIGRIALWAGVAAAVAIVAGLSLLFEWRSTQNQIAATNLKLAELRTPLQRARELIDNTSFARGWYDRRPKLLDCLREVTLAFPEEGRIWATNLAITEEMRLVITGKSIGEEMVLNLTDRLKSNPALSEVKPLYIRKVAASSQEVSFAITLSYVGGRS